MNETIIAEIITGLEVDLRDRRGLKHEWDAIDDDVKEEIRAAWRDIITKAAPVEPEDVSEASLRPDLMKDLRLPGAVVAETIDRSARHHHFTLTLPFTEQVTVSDDTIYMSFPAQWKAVVQSRLRKDLLASLLEYLQANDDGRLAVLLRRAAAGAARDLWGRHFGG